jgi:hypothetical protein
VKVPSTSVARTIAPTIFEIILAGSTNLSRGNRDMPRGEEDRLPLEDASQAEGYDTFPFRPGDRVEMKYPDPMWDDDGQEFNLVGWQGTVTEVCWDPVWTTHVMVEFPDRGCLCVGWDVITLVERSDQA